MLKAILLTAAAFGATGAIAQTMSSDPAAPASGTASSSTSAPSSTMGPSSSTMPGSTDSSMGTSTTADTTAAAGNSNAQVLAAVEAGFPKYDADKSGTLSDAEFKQWVSDLKTSEMAAEGKSADASAVKQYASAALKSADKDGDKSVTKDELTSFLGG